MIYLLLREANLKEVFNTEPEDYDYSKSCNHCSSIPHYVEAHMNEMVMN